MIHYEVRDLKGKTVASEDRLIPAELKAREVADSGLHGPVYVFKVTTQQLGFYRSKGDAIKA